MLTLTRTKYKIKVNYKSGISQEFWTYTWNENHSRSTNEMRWDSVYSSNQPMWLNVDEIESTWVIGIRVNVFTYFIEGLKKIKG